MEAQNFEGRATSAKVFTDVLEDKARDQVLAMLDSPAFEGCPVRIMPDVHAGAGCVIGFTSPVGPGVCPNIVGVDIGCGVVAARLGRWPVDFEALDAYIRSHVPSGFSIRAKAHEGLEYLYERGLLQANLGLPFDAFVARIDEIAGRIGADPEKVWKAVGTLGGGNHFIEVDQGRNGDVWLTLHSGSRNFGLRVANHHQKIAKAHTGNRNGLEYLEGVDADAYLEDMRAAQVYASLNRLTMLNILGGFFGIDVFEVERIESVHNFIGQDDIIRKGAISAYAGQPVIIPWNMRDGLIIGMGLGNPDWNYSAPHGAGRRMGRRAAQRALDVRDFKRQMSEAGVWSSCIDRNTLDEAPDAYKPSADVEKWLEETVEVVDRLRPVFNFKASDERG